MLTRSDINHLRDLVSDLEDIIMSTEKMSRSELDQRLSNLYGKMTTVVGGIMMDFDEMAGNVE